MNLWIGDMNTLARMLNRSILAGGLAIIPAVGSQVLAVNVCKVEIHFISLGQSAHIRMTQKVGHGYLGCLLAGILRLFKPRSKLTPSTRDDDSTTFLDISSLFLYIFSRCFFCAQTG